MTLYALVLHHWDMSHPQIFSDLSRAREAVPADLGEPEWGIYAVAIDSAAPWELVAGDL